MTTNSISINDYNILYLIASFIDSLIGFKVKDIVFEKALTLTMMSLIDQYVYPKSGKPKSLNVQKMHKQH